MQYSDANTFWFLESSFQCRLPGYVKEVLYIGKMQGERDIEKQGRMMKEEIDRGRMKEKAQDWKRYIDFHSQIFGSTEPSSGEVTW